jgi:hypothetical protein
MLHYLQKYVCKILYIFKSTELDEDFEKAFLNRGRKMSGYVARSPVCVRGGGIL